MKFFLYNTSQTLMPNIKATALSATVDQELGKYDALNASFAKTASNVEDFKKVDKIGVEVDGQLELFKITQPEISDTQITIAGVESASDDLAHQSYMLASSNDNISLSQALSMVFAGTTWQYDLQAPDTYAGIDFSTGDKQQALEQVLDTWQVECYFTYSATTSHITAQTCHIVTKRGIDTGKRLVKGVNVSSFTYSHDFSQVVTGAYATGTTPDDNATADTSDTETSNTTNQDTAEKKPYTLADCSWSTENGNPINHSLGDPTLVLEGATNKYGYVDSNGNRLPRMVTLSYSNDTPDQLIQHVYEYLLIHSQPAITLTATVYKLQSASLGDRFIAIDRDDDVMDASIRAIKIQRNLMNDALSEVTLGNYTIPSPAERAKKQEKQAKQAEKTAKEAKEKAEKADKETKAAKEKAEKADKDLDDYKESETKRRATKAKEHAEHKAAREKADADRDAKIAQNSKDISDIKTNGAGGAPDMTKLGGLITLEMEKDSKSQIKTVNINNKDKSQLVLKGDGLYWKSPDLVKGDSNKSQDEIDSENAKLTPPIIDQEGVMRPPAVIVSNFKDTKAGLGEISSNVFAFDISGVGDDNKDSNFTINTGAESSSWSIQTNIGKQKLQFDQSGIGTNTNIEINGYSDSVATDSTETTNLFAGTDKNGDFHLKLSTDNAITTINDKGATIDNNGLTKPPTESMTDGNVLNGLAKYDDTSVDNRIPTVQDLKAFIGRAIFNQVDHGTIYDATDFEDTANMSKDEQWLTSGFKHGSDRLVTYSDFIIDNGPNHDNGVIAQHLMDGIEVYIEGKVDDIVNSVLKTMGIDPSKVASGANPGAGSITNGN